MFIGSKGGGSDYVQIPDNLRSKDTFEGVLGLCAGPIVGPLRGLKSIKLDGTAVENETGTLNFEGFLAPFGDGDPLQWPQKIQLKLGTGAAPNPVNLSLTNPDGSNPVWVTKTMNNTNADFVDLRFVVQQLYAQNKDGQQQLSATIEVQLKPVGSTNWINPTINGSSSSYVESGASKYNAIRTLIPQSRFNANGTPIQPSPNFKIKGKTTSAVVFELRLALPNEGAYADTAWDIRCRLLERETYTGGDNGVDQEKRTISWESMSAVYSDVLGEHEDWRGVAWLQLYGQASDQLTGVPEVTGVYKTKIVSTPPPTVYNPDTRQYTTNIWDGSWVRSFTTDPGWIINDAISDSLSGLSLIAPGSYLNKWDALELSKYCSELVPDGNGGFEPRYSMNIAISEPQKAEELIRYLAGAVGAMVWDDGDGQWRCKVDKADSPTDIFTNDNIEGEFLYSHTDVDTRYNDIVGQFKNAEMDYRADSVQLFDNDSIAQIGRKPTKIVLVGCTGRQEAMRRVKMRLRTAVNENKIVSFTTNRRGRNISPLSTILIADGDLGDQSQRTTGRVVSSVRNYLPDSGRSMHTTGSTLFTSNGVSLDVVNRGVDTDGQEFVDYRLHGTNTGGVIYPYVTLNSRTAVAGEVWTTSYSCTLLSGSTTGFQSASYPRLNTRYTATDGTWVGEDNRQIGPFSTSRLVRTYTTPASAVQQLALQFGVNAGASVDCTFRVRGIMYEKASAASGLVFPTPTTGPADALQVRDPLYLAAGVSYNVRFADLNPVYSVDTSTQPTATDWRKPTVVRSLPVTNTLMQRGVTSTLYLQDVIPDTVVDFATIALEADGLPTVPRLYRVMSVGVNDDGERITITAINVDTGKWEASDNVSKEDTVFKDLRGLPPSPLNPASGRMLDVSTVAVEQGRRTTLTATWVRPSGLFVNGFMVKYSINGNPLSVATARTTETSFEWVNPQPGVWRVEVSALDRRGGASLPLVDTMTVTQDILDGNDIKYTDGTPIEVLQPAEPGATNSADPNSPFGSTTVGEMFASKEAAKAAIDALSFNAIRQSLAQESLRAYTNTLVYLQGMPVGTVIQHNEEQSVARDLVFAQTFDLIGAKAANGLSFIFNVNTVRVSPTETLGERFNTITTTMGDNTASISNLQQTLITPTGGYAKAVQLLDVNGYITGVMNTNDGVTGTYTIVASQFRVVDPNDGSPITPFSISGNVVRMTNVEVDTFKANSIESAALEQAAAAKTSFYNTTADTNCYQNTATEVLGYTFTKEDADSILKIMCYSQCYNQDDLQFTAELILDSSVIQTGRVNLIFDNSNSQAESPITLLALVPGKAAGAHTVSFRLTSRETEGPTVVRAGAYLEVTELRRPSISNASGTGAAAPAGTGGTGTLGGESTGGALPA